MYLRTEIIGHGKRRVNSIGRKEAGKDRKTLLKHGSYHAPFQWHLPTNKTTNLFHYKQKREKEYPVFTGYLHFHSKYIV